MNTYSFLLNLDTILDLTLGAYDLVYPGGHEGLLERGYIERRSDILSRLDPKIDDDAIRVRLGMGQDMESDLMLIKASSMSAILIELADQIREHIGYPKEHPAYVAYDITLNMMDVKLPKEWIKSLALAIKTILQVDTVTIVKVPLTKLTPEYIKSAYTHVVIRDLNDWTMMHLHALASNPMQQVTIVAPFMLLPDQHDGHSPAEIIRALRSTYHPKVNLEVIPLSSYSILDPLVQDQ